MAFYQNDNPELFDRAINSVFENSISPSEFILVQDGPVPFELSRIINKYSHKSILKHLVLEKNCGLAKALNFGLDHVSYDYVFRADADDFNLPDRFEKQISMLMKDVIIILKLFLACLRAVEFVGDKFGVLQMRKGVK